jgi:hypothetical protein
MNAPPDLRRENVETFRAKLARGTVVGDSQRRRDGEVVSRVQCGGLTDHSEIAVEPLELAAHPVEAAQQGGIVDRLLISADKTIEGRLDDR